MTYLISFINYSYLLSLSNKLMDMTINNPIFIFAVITIIWFIPGIVVRRITEDKREKKRKRVQHEAIEKLYPKNNN